MTKEFIDTFNIKRHKIDLILDDQLSGGCHLSCCTQFLSHITQEKTLTRDFFPLNIFFLSVLFQKAVSSTHNC